MKSQNLGDIFGESILHTKKRNQRNFTRQNESDFRKRNIFFIVFPFLALIILIVQLFNLTVVKGEYYKSLSLNNRFKEIIYPAPRGVIVDRKGEVIVRNRPGYIAQVPCGDQMCYRKISHDEALQIEAGGEQIPIETEISREYLDPFAFSHVVGITGAVRPEEIDTNHCGSLISYQDVLGRGGIEEVFDCSLQGTYGKELVEIDASGKTLKTLSKIDAQPGDRLTLAIDANLQIKAFNLLKDQKGAIVAHIPQTGEVLALVSAPSYDVTLFSDNLSASTYDDLVNDESKPLLNRAVSGTYPPGSTYKTIVASAALEEKAITKDTKVEDKGYIQAGPSRFHNWYFTQYGRTEGEVDVIKALYRSNDIFFYKTGEALGPDKIAFWARKFNYGRKLGIDIPGEVEGLIPDPKWKEDYFGEKWYLGDTYNVSIGQGNTLATPLQVAFSNGVFANNGILCKPSIVKTDTCNQRSNKLVSDETLGIITEGMIKACSEGGTGYPFFNFTVEERVIPVACKTGTAEFGGPDADETHAWFTVFAPVENPQIMVTVLVEGGGEGSRDAAPLAKDLLTYYFSSKEN